MAGEPVEGSWWSHRASHDIFAVLEHLEHHEKTLLVKLVSGKQTLVDGRLWQEFFSIACARDSWQTSGLRGRSRSLLKQVESKGKLRADRLRGDKAALKKAAAELESRLLLHAKNVHTESGAHARMLFSWKESMRTLGFDLRPTDAVAARTVLEDIVTAWKAKLSKPAKLPWTTS